MEGAPIAGAYLARVSVSHFVPLIGKNIFFFLCYIMEPAKKDSNIFPHTHALESSYPGKMGRCKPDWINFCTKST